MYVYVRQPYFGIKLNWISAVALKKGTRQMRALCNVFLCTVTMQISSVTMYNSGFTDLKNHFYDGMGCCESIIEFNSKNKHHFYV